MLWVATYGGGVNKYNKNITFRNYNKVPGNPKSLIDNMIWSILEDRQNRLWIGTNNGLDAFDSHTGEFTHHVHDLQNSHTLSHNVVRTLVEDHRGRIWAG
ncbi:MAG: hypothetical protein GWN16_15205, partial [Calditrichae bacterium]|nr:hypothetical protein [Calditrichia bacterium]